MREILFRGKRIDNGEWVEGNLFIPDLPDAPTEICIGTNVIRITYDVIPETIGQYTGLTDKNGKKIFEGDILKLWRSVGNDMELRMKYPKPLVVEYCDLWCQFVVEDNEIKEQYGIWQDFQAFEVIGNIHDNPELMKGE